MIRRGRLEHLPALLHFAHVDVDRAVGIKHLRKGIGFEVCAGVGDRTVGRGELDDRYARGAQRQSSAGGEDVVGIHAQLQQISYGILNAHVVHQHMRRGGIVRFVQRHAHGFHACERIAGEIARVAVRAVPALDFDRHVQHRRAGGIAHVEGGTIDRERLNRRTNRHLELIGAVQLLLLYRLTAAADHSYELARMPVQHRRRGLRLHHRQIFAAAQRGLRGGIVCVAHAGIARPV